MLAIVLRLPRRLLPKMPTRLDTFNPCFIFHKVALCPSFSPAVRQRLLILLAVLSFRRSGSVFPLLYHCPRPIPNVRRYSYYYLSYTSCSFLPFLSRVADGLLHGFFQERTSDTAIAAEIFKLYCHHILLHCSLAFATDGLQNT